VRKTILIITREIVPFYYGGIGTQFKAMANVLVSAGHEVAFLTQQHESYDPDIFQEHYPGCRVFFIDPSQLGDGVGFSYSGGLISHFNLCYASAVASAFEQIYQEYRPAHVVYADFGAELFFCLLKKQSGAYRHSKFIQFIEGSTYDALNTYESGMDGEYASELDDPQNKLTCAMEDYCLRLADKTIAPTISAWKQTQERLDLTFEPGIIPNLVTADFFTDKETVFDRQQSRTILFVGRLDHHKGADLLLRSFLSHYGGGNAEPPLLRFVGRDGFCKHYGSTFLEYWQRRIPENLKGCIEFSGQLDPLQVQRHLAEATLSVFPSRWEVFGIVCLEAMASGCPVVVSSHTGLTEVVGEGFREFRLDFEHNGSLLFELFNTLCSLEQQEYRDLSDSFRKRAAEEAKRGNLAIVDLFSGPASERSTIPEVPEQRPLADLSTCLHSISTIASILAHDFQQVTKAYNVDEATLKQLLVPKRVRE
jgi:glycosyltransferase involved in cell wall biosynthesis